MIHNSPFLPHFLDSVSFQPPRFALSLYSQIPGTHSLCMSAKHLLQLELKLYWHRSRRLTEVQRSKDTDNWKEQKNRNKLTWLQCKFLHAGNRFLSCSVECWTWFFSQIAKVTFLYRCRMQCIESRIPPMTRDMLITLDQPVQLSVKHCYWKL